MNIRKILGRVALAACALTLAGPVQAMAATPEIHPVEGEFPVIGLSTFGTVTLSTDMKSGFLPPITCSEGVAANTTTNKTTIEKLVILKGCKPSPPAGGYCGTLGQPSGYIRFESISHLVYLDENHTKPGILTTWPGGEASKLTCPGVSLGTVFNLKGEGMLAEITTPKCGETSGTSTVVSETSEPSVSKYLQVEETGTIYDLSLSLTFFLTSTVGISGTETITNERELSLTCPEQHE